MREQCLSIETERLTLREIGEADAEEIVRWRSIPENYQYFISPHPISIAEHLNWFYQIYSQNPDRIEWIAINRADNNKVGVFGINRLERNRNKAKLNYLLDLKYQHMGIAREAVMGVMGWAYAHWNIEMFVAEIHKDNRNSIHFINGMEFICSGHNGEFLYFEKIIETEKRKGYVIDRGL